MTILICILGLIIFILIIVLWKYQRQVKDICRQLAFLKEHDSNMMISREFDFGGIGNLANMLNDLLTERRKEKKKYQEKEKTISETYTSLSHDIRTPLTSLDGYFQLLEQCDNPLEQKKYITIIQERIESLKDMLEELFTFTKLKNESYQIQMAPCQINRILKETVFSYYEDWKNNGIEPEFEITEKPLYMEGNPQALKRVIQNIIKNVLEHGEKKIRILLQTEKDKICIKIRNDVKNPDEIDVDKVFERFYKADTVRSKNSTGLGLSIAKEFILRMNGEVWAELEESEFSIVIYFPRLENMIEITGGDNEQE